MYAIERPGQGTRQRRKPEAGRHVHPVMAEGMQRRIRNVGQFHLQAQLRQAGGRVGHLHAPRPLQRKRLREGVEQNHVAFLPSMIMQSPKSISSEVTPWSGKCRFLTLLRMMRAIQFSMTRLIHCGL